jgi:hypothetical protein
MLKGVASVVGLAAAFVGVMYLAYSGDTVPAPARSLIAPPTASSFEN